MTRFRFFLTLPLLMILLGCTGNNASSDRNASNWVPKTLGSSEDFDFQGMLTHIKTDVILKEITTFQSTLIALDSSAKTLQSTPTMANLTAAREAWHEMMHAWKPIQGNWIATIYDDSGIVNIDSLIDTSDMVNPAKKRPRYYLDKMLAEGKALESYTSIRYRNIGVVEALLFNENESDEALLSRFKNEERYRDSFVHASTLLIESANYLYNYWINESAFVANSDGESVDAMVNKMVDNIYKTRETRLGDPAGLTQTSGGETDPNLCEFLDSEASLASMRYRLLGLKALYTGNDGLGLDDYLISKNLTAENDTILQAIDQALSSLEQINTPLKKAIDHDKEHVKTAFAALGVLFDAFYVTLPEAVKLTPKIVEADGD